MKDAVYSGFIVVFAAIVWKCPFIRARTAKLACTVVTLAIGGLLVWLQHVQSEPAAPVAFIFLQANIVDERFVPTEYKRREFFEEQFGRERDLPQKLQEAFGRDRRFPMQSQPEYLRVTVRNAGALPITRIWIDFPVKFLLEYGWPSYPNVPALIPSYLNPESIMPADPRAAPLIFRDTPVMLAPGESFTFQLRNVSGANVVFDPLPTQAKIVTSAGEQLAKVQSVTDFGGPMIFLPPNIPGYHQQANKKTKSRNLR